MLNSGSKSRKMYKKVAVLFGVLSVIVLIMGAAIAYDWLVTRTGEPDTLIAGDHVITHTVTWGPDGLVEDTHGCGYDCDDECEISPFFRRDINIQPNENTYTNDTENENDTENVNDIEDASAQNPETHHDIDYADIAPDFALHDAYGNELRLSDFFGKPIVLNFWTTWCPSCVREIPYFDALYADMGEEVHIIKVNLPSARETRQAVDDFMEAGGHNFPLFFDAGDGAIEYAVRFIPMTFFIDAMGRVGAYTQGAVNEEILASGLAMIGVG